MFRASVILLLCIGAALAFDHSLDQHWEAYKTKHGKTYPKGQEYPRRAIWEKAVRRINDHNLKNDNGIKSFRLGLNKFADLTNWEFRRIYNGLRLNATRHPNNAVLRIAGDLPDSVDWRTKGIVTPVKNQEQCGSCWAFSTTGSLEGQHSKATGKLVSLSEQNLVDCSGPEGNQGCNGGLMDQAFDYIKKNGGIDTEESYPYTAQDGSCHFNKNKIGARVTGYVDIPSGDESSLQKAVANVGPVSVAIDASQYSFQLYSSGVYDEPSCSSYALDHGVLAVGYGADNGQAYWLVKNSWGADWGQEGYIWMSRNKDNQCGIATQSSYPTV